MIFQSSQKNQQEHHVRFIIFWTEQKIFKTREVIGIYLQNFEIEVPSVKKRTTRLWI